MHGDAFAMGVHKRQQPARAPLDRETRPVSDTTGHALWAGNAPTADACRRYSSTPTGATAVAWPLGAGSSSLDVVRRRR
jgi:hypothetical protein